MADMDHQGREKDQDERKRDNAASRIRRVMEEKMNIWDFNAITYHSEARKFVVHDRIYS